MKFANARVRLALVVAGLTTIAPAARAANHREAPITSLDRAADITDWYTFVSFDDPTKVTLVLAVDPLLEPSNGPNYFPFDPGILYSFRIDNDHDARTDVTFEVRFQTEIRQPGLFTAFVGGIAGDPLAVLGTYGATSRRQVTVRRNADDDPSIVTSGPFRQVQRMGNPLINELVIGTGFKDRFSMDSPWNDSQFASFFLRPVLADVFASLGIPVPAGDRTDLLPLVTYSGPIVPPGTPAGPIADLLRINTGIPPTPLTNQKRPA